MIYVLNKLHHSTDSDHTHMCWKDCNYHHFDMRDYTQEFHNKFHSIVMYTKVSDIGVFQDLSSEINLLTVHVLGAVHVPEFWHAPEGPWYVAESPAIIDLQTAIEIQIIVELFLVQKKTLRVWHREPV